VTVQLRLFAAARQAAGRGVDDYTLGDAPTVGALLQRAIERYGAEFAAVLDTARVWLNGDEPSGGAQQQLADGDEVAVLPPVSGGDESAGS
jgi:MoaD family protein